MSEPTDLAVATPLPSAGLVPGAPVETVADHDANVERREEHVNELPTREVPAIIPTHTPAANFAARDNIVADGPGTVAEFLPEG